MGRTTFEPAIGADRWPWPDLDVFVLGSHRPEGTPDDVVIDSDPQALLEQIREANRGGDVHLVGGPKTIETYRALGALDRLGLLLVPIFLGGGSDGRGRSGRRAHTRELARAARRNRQAGLPPDLSSSGDAP